MKKNNAILPAVLMVLMASCSNASPDSNSAVTPPVTPATPSSVAPPVGTTPAGGATKDNVEVKKTDSSASAILHPRTGSAVH